MDPTDEILLQQAVAGEAPALSQLLSRYGGEVRGAVAGAIGHQWRSVLDEDDVMQITYLEAFLQIKSFKPNGIASFKSWLRRIAENNLQDAIKGLGRVKRPQPQHRVQLAAGEDSAIALFDVLTGTSLTPSRVATRKERVAVLEHAISRLPPDYQTVIREHDLNGKSIEEVAVALNRSTGAVFMLRARAIEKLERLLPSISSCLSTNA